MSLKISKLRVSVEGKEIIKGLNLEIKPGHVHVIMGPNGSGKSTLANSLMAHPKYEQTGGIVNLNNKNINKLSADKRAQAGLFLSMQYPPEIEGVSVANFLRTAYNSLTGKKVNPLDFHKLLVEKMRLLGLDEQFARRSLNAGFSGGEKKRMEILQLMILNPKYAILDETDSGLDVDALKIVAEGINKFHDKKNAVLLITHYNRILKYIKPDFVHIMRDGQIIKSGKKELADVVEKKGYEGI